MRSKVSRPISPAAQLVAIGCVWNHSFMSLLKCLEGVGITLSINTIGTNISNVRRGLGCTGLNMSPPPGPDAGASAQLVAVKKHWLIKMPIKSPRLGTVTISKIRWHFLGWSVETVHLIDETSTKISIFSRGVWIFAGGFTGQKAKELQCPRQGQDRREATPRFFNG